MIGESDKRHQSVVFTGRSSYDIWIKHYKVKLKKKRAQINSSQ